MPAGDVQSPLYSARNPRPNAISNLVYAIAFSPDARIFAVAGGDDQSIQVHDLRNPTEPIRTIRGDGRGDLGCRIRPGRPRRRLLL